MAVCGAFQKFADSTLPYGQTFSDSPTKEERICVNGRKAHSQKGTTSLHRDVNGVSFGSGSFDPSFEDMFQAECGRSLAQGVNGLHTNKPSSPWDLHRKAVRELHDLVPEVDLQRLPSCVWCMRNFPTESLPCGHPICSSCVGAIGRKSEDDNRFIVELCDQHPKKASSLYHLPSTPLPKTIGRRLLSLDEGG